MTFNAIGPFREAGGFASFYPHELACDRQTQGARGYCPNALKDTDLRGISKMLLGDVMSLLERQDNVEAGEVTVAVPVAFCKR